MPEPIPANVPVAIIVARSGEAGANAAIGRPLLAIIPRESGWNDFGLYTSAELRVYPVTGGAVELRMSLMIQGVDRTDNYLLQLLGEDSWKPLAALQAPFCSVLSEIGHYKEIVETLGFSRAVSALRQLGDAVVLRLEGGDEQRIALLDSPEFHQSALRLDSAFVAYRRGARYLRPQPFTSVNDAATSFEVDAHLPAADNNYHVVFDFEPDAIGRNRVFVLIGKNGSGKTQLLLQIVEALRQPATAVVADESPSPFLPIPTFNRLLIFSSVASDPFPRSIPPWQGIDYAYHSMIGGASSQLDSLTTSLIDCFRDDHGVQFFEGEVFSPRGRLALLERALEPLGLWPAIHLVLKPQTASYDFGFLRTYQGRAYFPINRWRALNEQRSLLLVRTLDWSAAPVAFDSDGRPRNLSSGEYAMFRFAAQAAAAAEKGCIFLFDEPETHLHPNYISDFMDVLHVIVSVTRSVAIIATHSAYVVREVPRQRVRILSIREREVSVDIPRLQTYGASIDSISQFIFEDTNIGHRFQSTLKEWIDRLGPDVTLATLINEYGAMMNAETLSYVAELLKRREQ